MACELFQISHRMLLATIYLSFSSMLTLGHAVQEYYSVVGGRAFMSCNITAPTPKDAVTLVQWYKGDNVAPIYALDARKGTLEKALHYSGPKLGSRGYFVLHMKTPGLTIDPVHPEDDGTYRCRVDYRRHHTRNYSYRLHVTGIESSKASTEDPSPLVKSSPTYVTIQVGETAYLHCKAKLVGDEMVSWIRRRDFHLLTVGKYTYSTDSRFQSFHSEDAEDWTLQISYAQKSDEGLYECQITADGLKSTYFHLFVLVPHVMMQEGPNLYVENGSPISLSCVIVNHPDASTFVFWYKGDRMINFESSRMIDITETDADYTKSTLYINNAEPTDSGNYTCSPSNAKSVSTSVYVLRGIESSKAVSYTSTEDPSPLVKSSPTYVTIQVGETAYLHCKAKLVGHEMVSWIRRRDFHLLTIGKYTYSTDSRFQSIHLEDAEDWTLQISYAQKSDEGLYECQITADGLKSTYFQLWVVAPRAIIPQGPNLYVKNGSSISLSCVIANHPDASTSVFWYKGDRKINCESSRVSFITERDADNTKSTLHINNAEPTDSGNYTCSSSNAESVSTAVYVLRGIHSSKASVEDPSPLVKSSPTNVTIQVGETAYLHCKAKLVGHEMVSWIRHPDFQVLTVGRYAITSDNRILLIHLEDEEDWTLQIRYAQKSDEGLYECQITDNGLTGIYSQLWVVGSDSSKSAQVPNTQLSYSSPEDPERLITNVPTNVTVLTGRTANLHCKANLVGDQMVAWIRSRNCDVLTIGKYTFTNDTRIGSFHIQDSNVWALQITYARVEDEGLYECLVSGYQPTRTYFELSVVFLRATMQEGSEMFVKNGSPISLSCVIANHPNASTIVFWYKGDRKINCESSRVSFITERDADNTKSTLHINNAEPTDSGNYTCSPSNAESVSTAVHVLTGSDSSKSAQVPNMQLSYSSPEDPVRLITNLDTKVTVLTGRTAYLLCKANLVGDQKLVVPQCRMFVKNGSSINLSCVIANHPDASTFVFWYKGDRKINCESSRVSFITERDADNTKSTLHINNSEPTDSGNYTCSSSNAESASTAVRVTSGFVR